MSEITVFNGLMIVMLVLSLAVSVALFFTSAPYGRHVRSGWGPTLPNRLGWILMEAAAPLAFAALFILGTRRGSLVAWAFLVMWESHYLHRAFIYPFTRRDNGKHMPASIVIMGFTFNLANSYLNGRYLFTLGPGYPDGWLLSWQFLLGAFLFVAGYTINRQSDVILRRLRVPTEGGYRIPYGGLYHWISCPNYLGEIIEWFGWAIATWSLPGFTFAVWTVANLAPRARSHQAWYRQQFADYPAERHALIPGVW